MDLKQILEMESIHDLVKCVSLELKKKGRKNVDYQWSEYIVYLIAMGFQDYKSVNEIIQNFDYFRVNPFYLIDLKMANPVKVIKYYIKFIEKFNELGISVKDVFILGKNQSSIEEIKVIHSKFSDKSIKFKADIIIKNESNEYIGISVKDSEKATLSNYSVYKILPQIEKPLKEIQKTMILGAGLTADYKKNRPSYNKLFQNSKTIDNDYHQFLNEKILTDKKVVIEKWYNFLFGDLPYRVYTFNGTTLSESKPNLDKLDIISIPNPAKNPRGAAKLFYHLLENGVPVYLWEIRWKGDIFVSPQIQTHKLV
jgi:hypothetical protein